MCWYWWGWCEHLTADDHKQTVGWCSTQKWGKRAHEMQKKSSKSFLWQNSESPRDKRRQTIMMEAVASRCLTKLRTNEIAAKYWPEIHINNCFSNLALLFLWKTFGLFVIHVFHAVNCMKTTEGSYSQSVPMFSFATDVTVWPQSLCNGV